MNDYIIYLANLIPEKDSLKLVRKEAEENYKIYTLEECYNTGLKLYQSNNCQAQEVGVFLLGYSAHDENALSFLEDKVSQHESWKMQEILAMAFDDHCKIVGYEKA